MDIKRQEGITGCRGTIHRDILFHHEGRAPVSSYGGTLAEANLGIQSTSGYVQGRKREEGKTSIAGGCL